MINANIPLLGQSPDMIEAVNNGFADGGNFAKLLIGSQVNRMRDIEKPEDRQAFAKNNFFGRQLRAQLKEDEAAAYKAQLEQQKALADIGRVQSEAFKNNTQGQGYDLDNSGKVGLSVQKAISHASITGDKNAALIGLRLGLGSGEIPQGVYENAVSQLNTLTNPKDIKNFAMGMLDAKYSHESADNAADNITSRANNEATVGATLAGQQVQKEIADANRVSNDAYRMQQLHMQQNKGQIVNAADGKSYIYYPNLNKYEPMLDQSGQHVSKTSDQKAVNEENKRIQRVETLTPEIRKLLGSDGATGSFIGAGADWLGRTIGYSTEGSETTAQLKTLSGQLVALMPRMEGPQSNIDVEMYKEMAGNVADPTLPVKTRLAALSSIEGLNEKYKNLNQGVQTPQEHKGVPYASAGQATTSYNGTNVSLSEVEQAAKQAGISTEQMVSILKGQGVSIK